MKKIFSTFVNIVIGIVVIGALAIFATTLTHALVSPGEEEVLETPAAVKAHLEASSSTLPTRLIIPSIGVNAHIQHVGIAKSGSMAVPNNYTDAGWYKVGTIPGHLGNAVMAGHLDNGFGTAGVFKRINELHNGDDVMVVDEGGRTLRFQVIGSRTFTSSGEDTNMIFGESNNAQLNLITCEGDWNPDTKSYSERRVVFTEFVGVEATQ